MKQGSGGAEILTLQGKLASALYNLSSAYAEIGTARKELIGRKDKLSPLWFRGYMRNSARHQSALKSAIALGKALGDAYAWFLYQNDPALLAEHAAHHPSRLMPTGVGGLAELEFARGVQHMGRAFVLHHCMTTILRIGDVSVIQHPPLRVAAIGELKAGGRNGRMLDIELRLIGEQNTISAAFRTAQPKRRARHRATLARTQSDRVKRQLGRMADTLKAAARPTVDVDLELQSTHYWAELADAATQMRRKRPVFRRLGGGLMVVVYRDRRKSFYARCSGGGAPDLSTIDETLTQCAMSLVVRESPYNALVIGGLQYGSDGWPSLQLGTVPLFWTHLPLDLIHDIIFGKTVIVTVFNPATLLKQLVAEGFRVERFHGRDHLELSVEIGGRRFEMMNSEFWMRLVPNGLFREEQVVEMLLAIRDRVMSEAPRHGGRIDLRFAQSLMPRSVLRGEAQTEGDALAGERR